MFFDSRDKRSDQRCESSLAERPFPIAESNLLLAIFLFDGHIGQIQDARNPLKTLNFHDFLIGSRFIVHRNETSGAFRFEHQP